LGTTSQKAELTALARALTLAKGKTANIYTDYKHAFHTLLSPSAIWKERGFLTTRGTPIINAALIAQVLEASHLLSQIGITHCKAHQTDSSIITRGNNQADAEAKQAALQTAPQLAMYPLTPASPHPLNSLSPLLKLKLFSPIYIHFFILIFKLFIPFSANPFPHLQETYNTLNRLPNPAQFASAQTSIPILDPPLPSPSSQRMPPCHGLAGGLHTYASSKED
jgi:ribonuclease HI